MTNWMKKRSEKYSMKEANKKAEEEALKSTLVDLGPELKKALTSVGIRPFNRINRNLKTEKISLYGLLEGRLVLATMNRNGGFWIEYVK